jgi:predicted nucleic acid-binding protein
MTPVVVIDASLIFRLLVLNPQQNVLRAQVDSWQQAGVRLTAPSLWLYELTSAITKAVHFGDLSDEEGRRVVRLIYAFPIDLIIPDMQLGLAAFAWSRRLQRANAYDAFYLALAEALGAGLWTVDRRLTNAARLAWVRSPD